MRSTSRGTMQTIWKTNLGVMLVGVMALAGATAASARDDDRRAARRYDRDLDRQGALIDGQLDFLSAIATFSGEYELGWALDEAGDHIERALDRRGDRAVWQSRGHPPHRSARYARGRAHGWGHHHHVTPPHRHGAHCGHGFGYGPPPGRGGYGPRGHH